jgi:hypothetical protein
VNNFLLGSLTAFAAVISLLFLKFWRESKDRLFGFFAAAFALLAVDWFAHALLVPRHESQHYLFIIRLAAFVLLIAGIISKNRTGR